ncbi:hypothetical protein DV738_g5573, partial [Chaetothyriales sp. CBS 135597]
MPKRKRSSAVRAGEAVSQPVLASETATRTVPIRQTRSQKAAQYHPSPTDGSASDASEYNEDDEQDSRVSPDPTELEKPRKKAAKAATSSRHGKPSISISTSHSPPAGDIEPASRKKVTRTGETAASTTAGATAGAAEPLSDPDADGDDECEDPDEVKHALSRPPPVNSPYLPLPWKGRLGYACLNTYLRTANPPVFCSRTCRIASILEHRHPLKDPSQPEHATKNRPDKDQPADVARGQAWVESLGLANARDISKMLRWNERYGIKFLRLSSEMFPFASHAEHGYALAPFAAATLAEAGRLAAQLGHRLTTHPGQFTQLGSPRKEVITASIRDLEYHCELLDLLNLPPQQDRDAVIILHMGGVFGDKAATIARFKAVYSTQLSAGIQKRLVLENDDMCYSVHDLLPVCEELNIPLVLDFHHHNLIFAADQGMREGTLDITALFDRIRATWTRKHITQKMHYSEPTPAAITLRQRRKHSPRVMTLPPCPPDMDLMIEAKDKEQAVFELMRTFKLPGYDLFNDILPHTRSDENRAEVSMGGPEGRVYWPPGMEEWLRPKKRETSNSSKAPDQKKPSRIQRK